MSSDPQIRLLYVQPAEVFGGAERQGVLHMSLLAQHGFDVVPVVGPGKAIIPVLEEHGIHDFVFLEAFCHEAYYPLNWLEHAAYWGSFVRDWFAMQERLLDVIKTKSIDIILANRSTGWIAASWAAYRLRIPMVWRGGGRLTHWTESLALNVLSRGFGPDVLICNCEAVRANLIPYIQCASYVVNNGVDPQRFDPRRIEPRIRRELGLDEQTLVVGFPSRPAPEKGLEFLAEVVKRAADRVPKMRVLIAGEFGWRQHYEEMFTRLGLGERVTFLGHVHDIASFYRSCDVVVLTSKRRSIEGSPNAILEAMAMECPIVATDVGGVSEAVHHAVEGLLAPPEDAGRFADHLVAILSDSALRKRMGSAGRAAILQKYNHQAVVSRLASILREVALKQRAPSLREPSLEPA
jgi:glycosyltransferase involved in cell wall biosynthesis